jgi:regulator of protease activity HflC (stomatin/prohibitin superfamily)
VNRAPVTEEWSADENTGTSSKNEAIWSESSDSVGYSVGFNCTAEIQEKDAALFLYNYPNGSLAKIMNAQVRTRVQQIVSEVSTQYNMDILRTKKAEIISAVREDVIPFFGETGITITTLGLYGQFQYENPKIQASIDDVFVAQQEKAEEKAKLQAMADKQERMKQQGIAEANQAREIAQGEADAKVLVMKAEADGIRMVNQALQEAQSNPLFIKVKTLEVESERIKKWKGDVPRMQFGGDTGAIPLINISGME